MRKVCKFRNLVIVLFVVTFAFSGITQAADSKKVDITKATIQELVKLKGIGKKSAELIIEYREKHGKFEKVEDIMKVKGIGQKKFETMKDLIFVKKAE